MSAPPPNDLLSAADTSSAPSSDLLVEATIQGKPRALGGGFEVRRLLPSAARQMVGPFIFVDHFGPLKMDAGKGLDVRPHPHINLATVTYLFEGEILHRDSLGSEQIIGPGAVNWMTAGRGIVHSERSPAVARAAGPSMHGLQLWVALPQANEEDAPSFQHQDAHSIPEVDVSGVRVRVIAGSAYGEASPVAVHSPLFYVQATLAKGVELPMPDEHAQRAVYVVAGRISCADQSYASGTMVILRAGATLAVRAMEPSIVMLLGGAALDGDRYIDWNFVSSSRARIERAKQEWRDRDFPNVPGDEQEFIPLPAPASPL